MSNNFTKPFNPINWPAVPHDFTGEFNLGIYTSEQTQRYVYGTRYLTWDGRVYKYMGVTTKGVQSYTACQSKNPAQTLYTTALVTPKGSRFMTVTDATVVTVDQLAGGMLQIYDSTIANSHQIHIVGNELGNTSTYRIYLEFPLPIKVTASDSVEVFENPYRLVDGVVTSSNATHAHVGVPCVSATTGYKIWAQTWGPCIVSPGNQTLDDPANDERQTFFLASGALHEVAADPTAGKNQFAGYILNSGGSGIAGPQIYLMCST